MSCLVLVTHAVDIYISSTFSKYPEFRKPKYKPLRENSNVRCDKFKLIYVFEDNVTFPRKTRNSKRQHVFFKQPMESLVAYDP